MHLFESRGKEKVIAYPEGGQGTYSFVAATEDGFGWAVHTGGKITQIDVDAGAYAFVEDVPLKVINWGAAITREGYLVCEASPGDVMVYDTNRREVRHMLTPISEENHYAHDPRAASDGCVIIPMGVPGAEVIRLDPRTGEYESFRPRLIGEEGFTFPGSVTVLPDGRFAIPRAREVATLGYPGFEEASPLAYPAEHGGDWRTFRDYGDGRLFAYPATGGPLYRLNDGCKWEVYLEGFSLQYGHAEMIMFSALPGRRLLGMSTFGEVVRYEPDGTASLAAQLDNSGYQRISDLVPTEGDCVFTTTFINMSFQEMDLETGEGRNIRPCQKKGGQAPCAVWGAGKLWLACYGGAEITAYDPESGGEWPENPRPVLAIGEEQMRPVGLCAAGSDLWCATHAKYGLLGGALARIDTTRETCKVWRNLAPDHNPTSLVADAGRGHVYLGTTIHADSKSAPPAPRPAAVLAFDMERECVAWVAHPVEDAESMLVVGTVAGQVCAWGWADETRRIALLDAATGAVVKHAPLRLPEDWRGWEFFIGADGELYIASPTDGLFRYDPDEGLGERIIGGPVLKPRVRGKDLFFVRAHSVGVIEGMWP